MFLRFSVHRKDLSSPQDLAKTLKEYQLQIDETNAVQKGYLIENARILEVAFGYKVGNTS